MQLDVRGLTLGIQPEINAGNHLWKQTNNAVFLGVFNFDPQKHRYIKTETMNTWTIPYIFRNGLSEMGTNKPIGSMVLLYMVTWIPSIYPLYVSINIPAPWIRHGKWAEKLQLLASWMVTEVLAQRLPQKLRQTLRGWDLVVETCRSLKHRDLPGLVNIQKAIEHDHRNSGFTQL